MGESGANAPQGQDKAAEKSDDSQDSGTPRNVSALETKNPSPPSERCHPYHGQEPMRPWWKRNPQLIVEICVLVVGAYVACVYSGQLTQMRIATEASTKAANLAAEALDENRGQFERMMQQVIHQTAAQAIAANGSAKSADAAKGANEIAGETLRRSQRPWIGIIGAPLVNEFSAVVDPKDHTIVNIKLSFQIMNYGTSPALHLAICWPTFQTLYGSTVLPPKNI
jgi:hypothetical protein